MKLTFHPEPPKHTGRGRHLDPRLVESMDELKKHPGQWAMYPERVGNGWVPSLKKRGFAATARNQQTNKENRGATAEVWACWPTTPTEETPVTQVAPPVIPDPGPDPVDATTGKVLSCTDCEWATTPDKLADLNKHCRLRHGRPSSKIERTPVDPAL